MVSPAAEVLTVSLRTRAAGRAAQPGRARASVLATLVLLGAFGGRVWDLATPSFWWDDAYSAMVASRGLRDIVATLAREDYHPPLHYLLLHFWMRLVGQSEFALRYLSVGAGVLAVAAAWVTARRLLGARSAPLAATAFAFSPYLWYYSQEARMFALVPLFGTLALFFCARAADPDPGQRSVGAASLDPLPSTLGRVIRRGENPRSPGRALAANAVWSWGTYAALVALGLYNFYYAVFLPFAGGAWIILTRRGWVAFRRWAVATLAAFGLYLPWLPIFFQRSAVWSSVLPPDNGPAKVVAWSWPALLLGLPSLALYRDVFPAALLLAAAVATLVALGWSAGLVRASTGPPERRGPALAALAFVVPLLAMAAISAVKPIFHPRYAVPAEAGLLLLLAGFVGFLGSEAGRSRLVRRGAAVAVAALLLAGSGYGLVRLQTDPAFARDDYRGAIAYVQQRERPDDVILHNAIPPFWYYHHGPAPATYFPTGPYTAAAVAEELNGITHGRSRLWYVTHAAIPNDPDGFVDTQLRLHATRLDERWFGALRVQLWQIPRDDPFSVVAFQPAAIDLAGQFALTGYAVAGEATGGRTIDVELRVTTKRRPSADDGFWVALADAAGRTWGRADARPHDAAYRLSSDWDAGASTVIRFDLPVAIGTPPGTYHLVVGAYRLRDLVGLDVLDSAGHPLGQEASLGSVELTRVSTEETDPKLPDQPRVTVAPGLVLTADQAGPSTLAPGDLLRVTLLWRATTTLSPLAASLELRSNHGATIARDDGPVGGAFPTARWPAGATVREQRTLMVPATAPAGPAEVVLAVAGGRSVTLGSVSIGTIVRSFVAPRPTHPLDAVFGERIALVGYDLPADQTRPGDQLIVTLSWHALRASSTNDHLFVHLIDAQDHLWAQWDGVPRNWTYPFPAWLPGEYVVDSYPLTVNAATPTEELTLEVGLYDAASGQRVPVSNRVGDQPSDRVILQTVRVIRP